MRIIHTSDWHIGRRFEREPLEADQRAFVSWLAEHYLMPLVRGEMRPAGEPQPAAASA